MLIRQLIYLPILKFLHLQICHVSNVLDTLDTFLQIVVAILLSSLLISMVYAGSNYSFQKDQYNYGNRDKYYLLVVDGLAVVIFTRTIV